MTRVFIESLIESANLAITENADELTTLDQAIGDGDHGINMKRGFSAITRASDEISTLDFGQALQKAGMTLVMKVGGASGPLYGSFLMAMGKKIENVPGSVTEFLPGLIEGIEAVKKRGKSDIGAKTMLDVLQSVAEALQAAHDDPITTAREAANKGLETTRDMRATKGRASFLGERSIGHLDPGARSSALLVHAVCDVLEGKCLKTCRS